MSETMLSCDVLIVGGGPAGLSVAATLDDDISTIILHQDKEIGKPVRSSGGTFLSDVERLGIPRHLYQEVDTVDFYSDNERAHFPLEENNKLAVLDVTGTYKWIAERSKNKNRKLFLSSKFLSTYVNDEKEYISTIRSRTTDATKIKSKYIIDASGVQCAVLESLSLAKKPSRVGIGIELEYPISENDAGRGILFVGNCALAGYGWVFPTPDHMLRIGIGVIQPDTDISPRELMEKFIKSPELSRFGIKVEGEPVCVNAGIIPSVQYDPKLVFGNVIRVGDSANFATPTVGEGIRICMDLGELLGKELSRSIKSNSASPLRRYEKTCRKMLSKNYWLGFQINKRISRYKAPDWDRNVRRLRHVEQDQFASLVRCEFSPGISFAIIWKVIRRKIASRFAS